MRSLRPLLLATAGMVLLATGTARPYSCNDPVPQCMPSVDGTGCCDPATCSYFAVNTKCRGTAVVADGACKSGRCQANGSCQLDASNDGAYVKSKPCIGWGTNACNMGSCTQQGMCSLEGELTPVCDGDTNFCTNDCTEGPGHLSYTCEATTATNKTCYTGPITACVVGTCQTNAMGEAECQSLGGGSTNCTGQAVPTCKALTCDPGTGCGTVTTPGADCDPPGDTDCDERACSSTAQCRKVSNRDFGTNCTPGDGVDCTYDQCNNNGNCNYNPVKPQGASCTSANSDPCHYGLCAGSSSACDDYIYPNGTSCTEDTNGCTNQTCAAGNCTYASCAAGSGCAVCGYGGTCAGDSSSNCSCHTVP